MRSTLFIGLLCGLTTPSAFAQDARERSEPATLFDAGSVSLNFIGGAYLESFGGNDETLTFGGIDLEYFCFDDVAFTVEALGYAVDQVDPDAAAFGFSLGTRWYFWKPSDSLGVFVEGAVGLTESDARLPTPNGTHFNFTALAGIGAKAQLTDRISLIAAGRYFHLSNANMQGDERNPSIDAFGGFAGISISF